VKEENFSGIKISYFFDLMEKNLVGGAVHATMLTVSHATVSTLY